MFGKSPVDVYNSVMGSDVTESLAFGLSVEGSKKFMSEQGYGFEPKVVNMVATRRIELVPNTDNPQASVSDEVVLWNVETRTYVPKGAESTYIPIGIWKKPEKGESNSILGKFNILFKQTYTEKSYPVWQYEYKK
jgi:hypothetical protein